MRTGLCDMLGIEIPVVLVWASAKFVVKNRNGSVHPLIGWDGVEA